MPSQHVFINGQRVHLSHLQCFQKADRKVACCSFPLSLSLSLTLLSAFYHIFAPSTQTTLTLDPCDTTKKDKQANKQIGCLCWLLVCGWIKVEVKKDWACGACTVLEGGVQANRDTHFKKKRNLVGTSNNNKSKCDKLIKKVENESNFFEQKLLVGEVL